MKTDELRNLDSTCFAVEITYLRSIFLICWSIKSVFSFGIISTHGVFSLSGCKMKEILDPCTILRSVRTFVSLFQIFRKYLNLSAFDKIPIFVSYKGATNGCMLWIFWVNKNSRMLRSSFWGSILTSFYVFASGIGWPSWENTLFLLLSLPPNKVVFFKGFQLFQFLFIDDNLWSFRFSNSSLNFFWCWEFCNNFLNFWSKKNLLIIPEYICVLFEHHFWFCLSQTWLRNINFPCKETRDYLSIRQ